MTNEEAIEQFQNAIDLIKQNGKDWLDERDIPMLEMAIKALKQADGDLISRESVITMLNKIENAVEDGDGFQFNEWIDYAKNIPSAEKTAEWEIVGKTTLHYECSICGGAGDKWDKYCKHCGAKMKEGEEE